MVFRRFARNLLRILTVTTNLPTHVFTTKVPLHDTSSFIESCREYRLYPWEDRYSMDQIPCQNRGAKGNIAVKGSKSVQIKKKKTHFHKIDFARSI